MFLIFADLIGVHCTHGVNRTGYLICHYMIYSLGMSPMDAIESKSNRKSQNFH